jgi:hypothetical protein
VAKESCGQHHVTVCTRLEEGEAEEEAATPTFFEDVGEIVNQFCWRHGGYVKSLPLIVGATCLKKRKKKNPLH